MGVLNPASLLGRMGIEDKDKLKESKMERDHEIRNGPLKNRRCTDVVCLIIFLAYWVLYLVVTLAGFSNGSPAKLIRPRDFQGAYCGIESQWNNGPDLGDKEKLSFTMNVSRTTDTAAKQLLCSSLARDEILRAGLNQTDVDQYMCECCLAPCPSCSGSHDVGQDLASLADLSRIRDRMADLRLLNVDSVPNLFNPTGSNGPLFQDLWDQASEYLHRVCLPDCSTNYATANGTSDTRPYTYAPDADDPLKLAWETLTRSSNAEIQAVMEEDFVFQALPRSVCNYDRVYCVPFPGVEFEELQFSYCSLEMATEVIQTVGSAAASVYQSLGMDSFASSVVETFGKWVGDFRQSLDTFTFVCVCAFVIGLVFLIILRFFVKFCVWFAIMFVVVLLGVGGLLIYIRSFQCAGAGIFETGQQTAGNVATLAATSVSNALNGDAAPSEELTGLYDGNYSGVQQKTRGGRECRTWEDDAVYNAAAYPNSNLLRNGAPHNHCRNPFNDGDVNIASTIWCLTTDPEKRWEECDPISLIRPRCEHGYAVSGETSRTMLEVLAYVVWGLAFIWLLCVWCFRDRVRLAISLNRVGADFVATHPSVLLVPIVEIVIMCLWCAVWVMSASFLLSQVPDDHTPTGYYGSYEEARDSCYVNEPQGFVWKDAICQGDQCFRCAPPRYILDHRFFLSLFAYLWNSAMLVAIAQCLIAATAGAWFFTPNDQKGKTFFLLGALKLVFRYHPGSLALGAFLVAVVQFVRYMMYYLQQQAAVRTNRVCVLILQALACCLWCFENILKFINKNAYIQIALMGTPFCTSAQRAFYLILRNAIRFGMLAVLGKVIHFIGLLFIMASTVVCGYLLIREMHNDLSPVVPLVVYTFLSYFIAKLYMTVFGLAVDTCLQCYLICEEMELTEDDTFIPKYLRKCLKIKESPGLHQGEVLPLEADEEDEPAEDEPGVPLGNNKTEKSES